ncbi:hypothetical protein [Microbacterium sp. SORGH_AS_0421]|uniref:hypothetical protein n=1 Tax=Microbacterium sp. SORGH_AS_0421 TaxID=3041768 RepID=UPI00278CD082|nr:hypothetical protein [Microbacterium sp. SORGH_AS_0421]MDQ1178030.1 hypothetical protein [Microbacterium sp. SORGH_AS_0421]
MRGFGEDAHVGPVRWNGLTRGGARMLVHDDPASTVRRATDALIAAGFSDGGDTFATAIRDSGSEWVARDVRLGDIAKSRKRGVVEFFADGTGFDFFPRFWRGATPTVVVACARRTPEGAELIVYPHYSVRGGADRNDAAPLVRRAVEGLSNAYSASGALIFSEKLLSIKNDGSPASQAVVREVLGWR